MDETPPIRPPLAPPTLPGAPTATRRPAWPAALGIVLIVFASLSAINGGWTALSGVFVRAATVVIPNEEMAAAMRSGAVINLPVGLATLLVGVVGVFAGAALCGRRPVAVRLTCLWAWLRIVVGAAASAAMMYVQWRTQTEVMDAAMQQASAPPPAFFDSMMGGFMLVMGIVLILWTWALPVFMLFWLGRPAVKAEIARWSPAPARGVR